MWKWETEGQPKAVVAIIHSAYEYHRSYAWLIEKLRSAGFHIVMGDLPGHGEQAKYARHHDEDFTKYYNYVKQLIKVGLSYNLPIFILGNGLGATIAMKVLHKNKYECAGVILVSPWLHLKLVPGKLSNALTSLSALTANVKMNHDITPKVLTRNDEIYTELQDDIPRSTVVTVKWYKDLQLLMRQIKDTEIKFPDIPVLMMVGGRDQVIDVNTAKQWLVHQSLSHFQYKEWPECHHSLYFEMEREEVFLYTRDFMSNVLRSLGYII